MKIKIERKRNEDVKIFNSIIDAAMSVPFDSSDLIQKIKLIEFAINNEISLYDYNWSLLNEMTEAITVEDKVETDINENPKSNEYKNSIINNTSNSMPQTRYVSGDSGKNVSHLVYETDKDILEGNYTIKNELIFYKSPKKNTFEFECLNENDYRLFINGQPTKFIFNRFGKIFSDKYGMLKELSFSEDPIKKHPETRLYIRLEEGTTFVRISNVFGFLFKNRNWKHYERIDSEKGYFSSNLKEKKIVKRKTNNEISDNEDENGIMNIDIEKESYFTITKQNKTEYFKTEEEVASTITQRYSLSENYKESLIKQIRKNKNKKSVKAYGFIIQYVDPNRIEVEKKAWMTYTGIAKKKIPLQPKSSIWKGEK